MTIRLNPADLATTRSDLGLVIGTNVLAPDGSAANLTNMPADLSGDLRNVALGSAADRITLLNGIVDPLTDETDINGGTITFEGGTATTGNTHHGDAAWVAQRFTASQSGRCTGIRMAVAGSHFTSGCEIRLETSDGTTTPTGTLVDSNATVSTTGNVLETAADVFVTLDFATSFSVVKDTVYWIVVSRSDSSSYGLYRITSGAVTGTGVSLAGSFQAAYEISIKAVIVPGDSINQTFTSGSGGYYRGSDTLGAAIAQGAGTAIGNATANGGLAASFDGTTSQAASASSKYAASSPADPLLIGKNHGSGVTKTIAGITVVGSSDQGFQQSVSGSITIKLQGSTDNFSSSVVDLGTETFTDSAGKTLTKTSGFTATAFQYHRIHVTAGSGSGSQSFYVAECTFFEEAASNMTLISNPYTATSAPSKTVFGLQTVENETITINTDLKGFVSRDGGSNFTEVTLVLKTTLGQTGTKYYECAETTISSTSGSSMVWKITTHNTKDVEVHGVALSWS